MPMIPIERVSMMVEDMIPNGCQSELINSFVLVAIWQVSRAEMEYNQEKEKEKNISISPRIKEGFVNRLMDVTTSVQKPNGLSFNLETQKQKQIK